MSSVTAKQRYISTSYWDDNFIMECIPDEKLVFMYLLTNSLTNIAGVYEIAKKRIAFDTGLSMETVAEILNRFEKAKKVFYFHGYIIIRNFPNHQKYQERSKINIGIQRILLSLDKEILYFLEKVSYTYPIRSLYNYSDSEFDFDLDSDRDRDRDSEEPAPASEIDIPESEEEAPPLQGKHTPGGTPDGDDPQSPAESDGSPPGPPDPRGKALDLAASWYREYSRRTARVIGPGEDDIKSAWELLRRTDLPTARDAIPIYFECDDWFMFDRGKKTKRFSFQTFCRRFTELTGSTTTKIDLDNLEAANF